MQAVNLNDLETVYHRIISLGGSPDNYLDFLVTRYLSVLAKNEDSSYRFAVADADMERNFSCLWDRVNEQVWQIVDDKLETERTEKPTKLDGEKFLASHYCHTDEIWYAEDAMGNPIGSKSRCPECVNVVRSLNTIHGYRKF